MRRPSITALVVVTLAACGGGRDASADSAAATAAADGGESAAAAPAASAPATDPVDQPLAVEDIDRWAKGLDAEQATVDSAAQRLKQARTTEDTLGVMSALQETATAEAGAKAAGVSVDRYRAISQALSSATQAVAPPETNFPPEMLTPQMREELKKGSEATLARLASTVPASVIDGLRPRAAELRKKELTLTGTRLKAVTGG